MAENVSWTLVDHLLDPTSDRLILQVDMREGHLVNLIVERATDPHDKVEWRHDLFELCRDKEASAQHHFQGVLDAILDACRERYQDTLPIFGNALFIEDKGSAPAVFEKVDPQLEVALRTASELFDGIADQPSIISRFELQTTSVENGFFFPQTKPVIYKDKIFVAKGPASAERVEDDFREVVHLLSLPSQHPNILPPPSALVKLSLSDERLCGFLTPLYEHGNIDHYARRQRDRGLLTSAILCRWFLQLASAVKFLIDAETWHGDIKPDNILISQSSDLVLIDLSRKYTTMTVAAPEVCKGTKTVPRRSIGVDLLAEIYRSRKVEIPPDWPLPMIAQAEIYSVGRTMFFIFEGISMMEVYTSKNRDRFPTEFSEQSPTPKAMQSLILECVQDNASLRPTPRELVSRLEELSVNPVDTLPSGVGQFGLKS